MQKMEWVDAHRHFCAGNAAWEQMQISLSQGKIGTTLLFGHNFPYRTGCDAQVWELHQRLPDKIIPLACEFTYTTRDIVYAKQCMKQGFAGFGELLLGHKGMRQKGFDGMAYDDAIPVAICRIAGQHKAFVLVHSDASTAKSVLHLAELCPQTNIIWAHIGYNFAEGISGQLRPASQIAKWLEQYPNLLFDTSFWEKSALCMKQRGYLDLLEQNATRFLFGLDMTQDYVQAENKYLPAHEAIYERLSAEARNAITGGNVRRLVDARCKM